MARRKRKNPYRSRDPHADAARAAGYPARSVFKLQEIDKRLRLLKQGQHVLDLGAAPGSWASYACERVGKTGRVVAVDLKPIRHPFPEHAAVIEGDAFDEGIIKAGPVAQHAPYDVVLSDMAPNTTGDKRTDKIRSLQVFSRAADVALELLKPGGHFVGKLFMGGDFAEARERLRSRFTKVRTIRPDAVRTVSYEVFLVGLDLKVPQA